MTRAAILVATVVLCAPQLACAAHVRSDGAADTATCPTPRYLLTVRPRTTVSNEQHRLEVQATTDACGRHTPTRGGRVRLGRYGATTSAYGRAILTVRLSTGRYFIRLYVHRQVVARTHVYAIPNVSA